MAGTNFFCTRTPSLIHCQSSSTPPTPTNPCHYNIIESGTILSLSNCRILHHMDSSGQKHQLGMRSLIGNGRHKEQQQQQQQLAKRSRHGCAACFCCSSRPSVSSCDSSTKSSDDSDQLDALSSLAHGMVQARLEQMVSQHGDPGVHHRRRMSSAAGETSSSSCILLIAMDRRSYDPKGDFKMSILEVIKSRRIKEPNELRNLLNCYLSMNSSEQRLVILEAFYEVCSSLFHCRD